MRAPLNRRDFVKAGLATTAAAGLPGTAFADVLDPTREWKWDRGVCRFCGVGCGIEVATRDGRVVAVRGKTVRLGLRFPREVSVLREEVFLQIREVNESAARAAARLLGEDAAA